MPSTKPGSLKHGFPFEFCYLHWSLGCEKPPFLPLPPLSLLSPPPPSPPLVSPSPPPVSCLPPSHPGIFSPHPLCLLLPLLDLINSMLKKASSERNQSFMPCCRLWTGLEGRLRWWSCLPACWPAALASLSLAPLRWCSWSPTGTPL